jgi:hypothetical protein
MKLVIYLSIVLILTSCTKTNKYPISNALLLNLPVNIEYDNGKFELSDFYSEITGFSLDNSGELLGHISKVIIWDSILFVFDAHIAKKIAAYDLRNNGKFLYMLGRKGQGPGEFVRIADFTIDSATRQLLIIDHGSKRLSYFDLNGNFINARNLKFRADKIVCREEYLYFIKTTNDENDCGLVITDKRLNVLRECLPFNTHPVLSYQDRGFLCCNEKLILNYPNSDTIYCLNQCSLEPHVIINSGSRSIYSCVKKNGLKQRQIFNLVQDMIRKSNTICKDAIIPKVYFENDRLISFEFGVERKRFRFLVDKRLTEPSAIIGVVHNDIFNISVEFLGYDDNHGTIAVSYPGSKVEIFKKNMLSERLITELNNMNENSNPFIIFLK